MVLKWAALEHPDLNQDEFNDEEPDYFDDQFLRRLLISQEMQAVAQEAATRIGQLTRCF